MALFGNGSGSGLFADLKERIGLGSSSAYDGYDQDYDVYSDNYDGYSSYDRDSYEDEEYGEVIERDPREREYHGGDGGYRGYRYTPLMTRDEIRRNLPPLDYSIEPRVSENRQSFRSTDYLSSGAVERESAAEASRMPRRHGFGDFRGPQRKLTVIVPSTYEDAEKVALGLKASETVVLNLKNVRHDLTKRILDFSFGAASVADARVDCIGDKVFALTTGGPITEGERVRLRSQGVVL